MNYMQTVYECFKSFNWRLSNLMALRLLYRSETILHFSTERIRIQLLPGLNGSPAAKIWTYSVNIEKRRFKFNYCTLFIFKYSSVFVLDFSTSRLQGWPCIIYLRVVQNSYQLSKIKIHAVFLINEVNQFWVWIRINLDKWLYFLYYSYFHG